MLRRFGSPLGRSRPWRIGLVLMALLALGSTLGVVAAHLFALPPDFSPATGHAQVIAQGVVPLRQEAMAWRTVRRTAQPRTNATFGAQPLGFVLASDQPILLTSRLAGGTTGDEVRLARGEGALVRDQTEQQRASLSGTPTDYLVVELVPAAQASNVGAGKLLYAGAPFTPSAGDRDVDLVRNVLSGSDQATVPDSGGKVVILATDGAVDVIPSGGRVKTLQVGETATFTGTLTVKPAVAGSAARKTAALAGFVPRMLSAKAQTATPGGAYVVAVIGVTVPPGPSLSPNAPPATVPGTAPAATPGPRAPPPPTAAGTPAQAGEPNRITAHKYTCPAGYDGETSLSALQKSCPDAANGVQFNLAFNGAPYSQSATGDSIAGAVTFGGLQNGDYALTETIPAGTRAVYVYCADGGGPLHQVDVSNGTVSLSLNAQGINCVWFDQPARTAPAGTVPAGRPATITAYKYTCPAGYDGSASGLGDFQQNCPDAANGVQFNLAFNGAPYSQSATGDSIAGAVTFGGLDNGGYDLTESAPVGTNAVYAFCSVNGGGANQVALSNTTAHFDLNGESIVCNWYDVPSGAPAGETPTGGAPASGTPATS